MSCLILEFQLENRPHCSTLNLPQVLKRRSGCQSRHSQFLQGLQESRTPHQRQELASPLVSSLGIGSKGPQHLCKRHWQCQRLQQAVFLQSLEEYQYQYRALDPRLYSPLASSCSLLSLIADSEQKNHREKRTKKKICCSLPSGARASSHAKPTRLKSRIRFGGRR
jgi:hypothetical protein